MPNYTDHSKVLVMITNVQDAEEDIRELSRSCDRFIDLPDGQWEPNIARQMGDRPMLTYDETSGLVDDIAGDLEATEFAIKVSPAGGGASEDTAEVYSDLIRNTENMSNAKSIYSTAGRGMVTRGIDGWRVITKFAQSDSFDQDLFIVPISNFIDRVWFDPGSELADRSDANWCVVLQSIPIDTYNEMFPDGSGMSVSEGKQDHFHNTDQIESVVVGELLYKKQKETVLIKMSNGAVYTEENIEKVKDELADNGVTEEDRRTAKVDVVYSRKFDGGDWLESENKTVFEYLPIIPAYALFKIVDNKVSWRGEVVKKMDPQRALNYAESRKIEEGALAPRAKYWMTEEQAQGHEAELETMNQNAESVQFYNHVEGQLPVTMQGGAIINQGLMETAQTARSFLRSGAGQVEQGGQGLFQSGEAQRLLQNKADTGNIKYSKGLETAICHTARILMNALPKVITGKREARAVAEDGSSEMIMLNQPVFDEETQEVVMLNDLTRGIYDVVCSVGPAFKNRQEEAVKALIDVSSIIPGLAERGADVLLKNIAAPGMDTLRARERQNLIRAGVIPEDQLTDDEKAELQAQQQAAAQQPQEPSAEDKAAQSLLLDAETNRANIVSQIEDRQVSRELEIEKIKMQAEKDDAAERQGDMKLQQSDETNAMKLQQQRFDQSQARIEQQQAANQQQFDNMMLDLKTGVEALKTIREAMGVDSIVGAGNTEAYIQQARAVTETQEEINPNLEATGIVTDSQNLTDDDRL